MKQKFLVAITAVAFSLLTACDNGTSSGDVVATSLNDSRDGQIYNIVKIGDQVWMAENLKYEIPVATGEEPKSFCYSDSEINCGIYGRLYTWDNAANICPEGWHLPDTTEWNKLFDAVGGKHIAGKKLKAVSNKWLVNSGTDEFGFGALPAGFKKTILDAYFFDLGSYGNFWTDVQSAGSHAYHVTVFYDKDSVKYIEDPKDFALSVRCIKN